jgi:predicted protein tyrosine phosphatase
LTAGLYWIKGPWPGRLAIVARPRGGDWLEDEVRSWARSGLQVIVSLLTPQETAEFDLTNQGALCRSNGIEFVSFPIPDRGVPSSGEETLRLVRALEGHLAAGTNVGIHCRQGIGRSGLAAACALLRPACHRTLRSTNSARPVVARFWKRRDSVSGWRPSLRS